MAQEGGMGTFHAIRRSLAEMSHRRSVASSRTRSTSLASVVTPGSSTPRSKSQPIASLKIALGPITRRPRPRIHPFLKLPRDHREIPQLAGLLISSACSKRRATLHVASQADASVISS